MRSREIDVRCGTAPNSFGISSLTPSSRHALCAPPAPRITFDERGLIGLFLCGSLASQFEKLYSRINANDFSKVYAPGFDTQDALLANLRLRGRSIVHPANATW